MDNSRFYGIFSPVVCPCDDNDNFLPEIFEKQVERLFKAGVNGLYVCGGTGDAFNLRVPERKQAAEIAARLSQKYGRYSIIHVGATHLRDSSELARHAADIGALGVSSIPPIGLEQSQIVEYYSEIAKESGLPVLVYHIPAVTHRNPSMEELLQLLNIEGVVGLKMTDWNLFLLRRLILEKPGIIVYNGYDELIPLGLLYGAKGSIGTWSNLFPEMYVRIYREMNGGSIEKAMDIQKAFVDFLHESWKYGVVEVFEELMREFGYAGRCFRKPYSNLDRDTAKGTIPGLMKKIEVIHGLIK